MNTASAAQQRANPNRQLAVEVLLNPDTDSNLSVWGRGSLRSHWIPCDLGFHNFRPHIRREALCGTLRFRSANR
jgi:hypothetical protein